MMTDRQIVAGAWTFLIVMAFVAVYAVLAAAGKVPAMPWSPIGQLQHHHVDAPRQTQGDVQA